MFSKRLDGGETKQNQQVASCEKVAKEQWPRAKPGHMSLAANVSKQLGIPTRSPKNEI